MTRRLLNLLTALSLLFALQLSAISCSRTITERDAAPPRRSAGAQETVVPDPSPAETLVAALRNDQLVWEIEWPTPDTYKDLVVGPHFSPRGRPGSAVEALAPWQPLNANEWPPDRPPFGVRSVGKPLLKALSEPDQWVAAHVVLTHIILQNKGETEMQLRDQWFRDYSLKEYSGFPKADFAAEGDGAYRYAFNGVTAHLRVYGPARPFDYSGSYGGKFTVRAASARIDPKQMADTRQRWEAVLKSALEYTAESATAPEDGSEPEP